MRPYIGLVAALFAILGLAASTAQAQDLFVAPDFDANPTAPCPGESRILFQSSDGRYCTPPPGYVPVVTEAECVGAENAAATWLADPSVCSIGGQSGVGVTEAGCGGATFVVDDGQPGCVVPLYKPGHTPSVALIEPQATSAVSDTDEVLGISQSPTPGAGAPSSRIPLAIGAVLIGGGGLLLLLIRKQDAGREHARPSL